MDKMNTAPMTSFIISVLTLLLCSCGPSRENRIVVGSKNFTEQLILGEVIAQQIETQTHLAVERRFYLACSYICHQAILGGRIDIYPEHTATSLSAILLQTPEGNGVAPCEPDNCENRL